MSDVIKIKKGLDIQLKGRAEKELVTSEATTTYAIKPPDFEGLTPKLAAKEGSEVKAGSVLFYDKNTPEVKFTSPVSGSVKKINRGARRRILEVIIEASTEQSYETFAKADPNELSGEAIREQLLKSGLWPMIRRRPYNIVARPDETPDAIFISGFDTRPLGPDLDFIVEGEKETFQTGIDALAKLTQGQIYLSLQEGREHSKVFTEAQKVTHKYFNGPHPAGEVGIQMHHISPLNKGQVYWHVHPQDILTIGRLFLSGQLDPSRIVALVGSEVKNPQYYKVLIGAAITNIVKDNLTQDNVRYVSGSVLSGTKIRKEGYIGFYDHQVAVLPEGNEPEMFGWLKPGFDKFSLSRTFFTWLMPKKEYRLSTNMNGGHRAFVVTGEYEKVFPMDILPQQLLKAIIVEDIDKMEQMGIYEIAEEDVALMEYVCTSKQPVQKIVRQGLNLMLKEVG